MARERISQKHAGVTLIEIVLVIVLVSLLTVGILFQWPETSISLAAQAEQLANDLRYTQSLAMTKGQRFRLVKISASSYQIQYGANSIMVYPGTGTTTINFGTDIFFGVWTNLPNNSITFDGKGRPYIDLLIPGTPLATNASISLVSGGKTKTIQISPETGRVIVQ